MAAPPVVLDPSLITRPDPVLRTYYIVLSVLTGPGIILSLPLMMFRYVSLRYRFDDQGIAMSWGVLFRQEIYLTYRRIQDIHVTRGIIQRWMGIATISIQTASGTAGAEMAIEGIVQYEALRDILYQRMRGAHGDGESARHAPPAPPTPAALTSGTAGVPPAQVHDPDDRALALLRDIHAELQRIRAVADGPSNAGPAAGERR